MKFHNNLFGSVPALGDSDALPPPSRGRDRGRGAAPTLQLRASESLGGALRRTGSGAEPPARPPSLTLPLEGGGKPIRTFLKAFAGMRVGVLALGLLTTPALAAGNAQHGQQVFQDNCTGCHALTGPGLSAPPLGGVYGRKAGTADFMYSDAMKKSGIVWDDASLKAFLADPSKAVPGTAMFFNVTEAQDRDDVAAYLKTLSPASH